MARDLYKYFRIEARELLDGLTDGILQLEKADVSPDTVARLLRIAHTLKGAARVVKQPEIAEFAHTIEDVLAGERETNQPISREQGSALLGFLDGIGARLSMLEGLSEVAATRPAQPVPEEPLETLRVEIHEIDALLRGVTEAGVHLGGVRKGLAAADRVRDLARLLVDQLAPRPGVNGAAALSGNVRARSLAEDLHSSLDRLRRSLALDVERIDVELAEVRDVAHRLRLIPARSVFPSLERAVRDASQALGKRVDFEAAGGEVRLDANVLAALRDALIHVVRNAVAHGIESEAERGAAGKSPAGHVRLEVERRGTRVAFICRDDGRGVDVEAVRKAAVARGLVSAAEARILDGDRVIGLLCTGGLTTSSHVTELSGRGIGLESVRATSLRLKGAMSIRSEPRRGATIELEAPVSVASLDGLVVEAAGALAAIPLAAIRGTLRIRDADVARSAEGDSIVHEGKVIPFLPLERTLRRAGSTVRSRRTWSAVVIQSGIRKVAVGVDKLIGTSSIVMWSLPVVVEPDPVVSGASLDAEGNPQLVLDPDSLIAAAERGRGEGPDAATARRAPVLIVDDSLTTRMLEQTILESAGFEVDVAVSAEEALKKAHDCRYSLFIVDVEMPGIDGFEFVAKTRSDPLLRDIPAILVTSRNAPEDRRRGQQVGARAYIVKGEFDQAVLLHTIRGLIG